MKLDQKFVVHQRLKLLKVFICVLLISLHLNVPCSLLVDELAFNRDMTGIENEELTLACFDAISCSRIVSGTPPGRRTILYILFGNNDNRRAHINLDVDRFVRLESILQACSGLVPKALESLIRGIL